MEQAFGDSRESMVGNDWLLVLVLGDLSWSAAGDRQPRESAEVDGKLSVLASPAGDSSRMCLSMNSRLPCLTL